MNNQGDLFRSNEQGFASSGTSDTHRFSFYTVLKYLAIFVAVFFTAIIQSGFFSEFRPFGVAPDLCLALSVAVALRWGAKSGAVVGIMSGFCLDCLSKPGFSLLIPFYFLLAVAIGLFAEDKNARGFVYFGGAVAVSAVLRALLSFLELCLESPSFSTGKVLTGLMVPNIFVTLIFSPLAYLSVLLADRIFGRKDKTTRR